MSRLRIAPIVEGHGEDGAIRILLERIWYEMLGGEYVKVLKPLRGSRFKLVQAKELERALNLVVSKLRSSDSSDPSMVLVLLDAESDLPCILGPEILAHARRIRADADISCVIANIQYETWFVAAAESLESFLDLSESKPLSDTPEQDRKGKGWIKQRFRGVKYSETVDQPAMSQAMDLKLCRRRSPSFDKLYRELQVRMAAGSQPHSAGR